MASEAKWRTQRRASKAQITAASNRVDAIANETMTDVLEYELENLIARVEKHWEIGHRLTEKILEVIPDSDDAKLAEELKNRDDVENTVFKCKMTAQSIIKDYQKRKNAAQDDKMRQSFHDQVKDMEARFQSILTTVAQNQGTSSGTSSTTTTSTTSSAPRAMKLPTLPLKPFSGDIMEWLAFWENFEATIDKSNMADVEKLSYLRSYLRGQALLVISNLSLTATNYPEAKRQLEQTYGKKNILIEAHLRKLENLPAVKKEADVAGLKNLHLFLKSHIHSLDMLGKKVDTFATLLGPMILRSIPAELKKKWTQDAANEATDVTGLLTFLEAQTNALERFYLFEEQPQEQQQQQKGKKNGHQQHSGAQQGAPPPHQQTPPAAQALATQTKGANAKGRAAQKREPGKCLFCPETHWANKCPLPTKTKLDLVVKEKRCFRCLNSRHATEDCTKNWKCFKCNSADHHTALCQAASGQTRANATCAQTATGGIFLKTATVMVHGPAGSKRAICLVDDGSQRTYVRRGLAEELALGIARKEELEIYAFGSKTPAPVENLNLRNLRITGTFPSAPLVQLEALDKEEISTTSPYIHSEFARKLKQQGKFLGDDRFFSSGMESPEIDILIGADHIWDVCGQETIASSCGLRAVNSKLGWLLLGPSANNPSGSTVISMLMRCTHASSSGVVPARTTTLASQVKFNDEVTVIPAAASTKRRDTLPSPEEKQISDPGELIPDEKFSLQAFWMLERQGITDDPQNFSKFNALEGYEESITRQESGRYEAPFPWNDKRRLLETENNYDMAIRRMDSLLRRLRRTPVLLEAYDAEIRALAEREFVERCELGYEGVHAYIPHQPVIREDKETTKIRPVFDASAKSRSGTCLNDCLETGPNLNPDLMAVLMRFRLKTVAWIADIEKAFLNIALPEEESNVVRFLWSANPKDPKAPVEAYRWKRVPFGLRSSPFQLRATISKHLKSFKNEHFDLVNEIENQLYVDDLLGGAHDVDEAAKAVRETNHIFADAKLKMTKWTTNSPELRKILEEDGLSAPTKGLLAQNLSQRNSKVLGIQWDTESDSFLFNPTEIIKAAEEVGDKPTKRNILQISSRIFDPLGFLGPTVLSLKMLFQKLWEAEIGWDQEVPDEVKGAWLITIEGLKELERLKIPRWLGTGAEEAKPAELHIFGDASKKGYGTVAYIREERDGKIETRFLCSKTVVAPPKKKEVSLPRLELLSSLLAVRLGESIKNAMHGRQWTTTYWSDSKVALGWIKGDSVRWQTFVKNRVDKIQQYSSTKWWRHCPGIDNPADLASRGASAQALVDSQLWWNGPSWLSEPKSCWPEPTDENISEMEAVDIAAEKKKAITLSGLVITEAPKKLEWNLERVSSWSKLVRRMAWMLRFCTLRRPNLPPEEITGKTRITVKSGDVIEEKWVNCLRAEEIRQAEIFLFRLLQRERYPQSYEALENGQTLHPQAKLTKLRPVWDPVLRLIRVTGRMELAIREEDREPPILLPENHPVVELIVRDVHRRLLHAGLRSTHSEMREHFWVIKGRQQVKKILNQCVICRRLQSRPFDQLAAPIPIERVRRARPFDSCGVDFAGPLYYKPYKFEMEPAALPATTEGVAADQPTPSETEEFSHEEASHHDEASPEAEENSHETVEQLNVPAGQTTRPKGTQKAYICLFTCAYTRAVHLELVRDLSAATFLLALRRFFNARGGCSKIFSDNAQTFACVSKYLKVMRTSTRVCDFLAQNQTEWQFSAALAPWWGGFWERMVRTVKELFRKGNGKAVLYYDQLMTALSDVEAVINARPLVYVADGEDDPRPITPSNLIYGYPTRGGPQGPPPDPATCASAKALIQMDKARRRFVEDCANQFVKEYLSELNLFHSKGKSGRAIRIGEVVVIHDGNAKRLMWSTGVVKQLLTGRDGRIRSALVKIPSGTIISRAIQSLYPIELQEDQPEELQPEQDAQPLEETETQPEPATPDEPTPAPVDLPNATRTEESPIGDSAGENVVNVNMFRRPAGRRVITLSRRARASAEGER